MWNSLAYLTAIIVEHWTNGKPVSVVVGLNPSVDKDDIKKFVYCMSLQEIKKKIQMFISSTFKLWGKNEQT